MHSFATSRCTRLGLGLGLVLALAGCGGNLTPPQPPNPAGDPPEALINLEAESAPNGNAVESRSEASGRFAVLLKTNGSVTLPFDLRSAGPYKIAVRYSTDGPGTRSEQLSVSVDGKVVGQFEAQNTLEPGHNPGDGWNSFHMSPSFGALDLSHDTHTIVVQVTDGDDYGIDIDGVGLTRS